MFVPEKHGSLAETYSLAFFKQHQAHLPAYQALTALILSTVPNGTQQSFVDVGCGHGHTAAQTQMERVKGGACSSP